MKQAILSFEVSDEFDRGDCWNCPLHIWDESDYPSYCVMRASSLNCPLIIKELPCPEERHDEQRKVIERQQFVLDIIKDWANSEQRASIGYQKARMAVQALIKGMLEVEDDN